MIAKQTLERYIECCDNVIDSNDISAAESLENEIVSVLGQDIKGIKSRLSNYSPCFMSLSSNGITTSSDDEVDYIGDIKLLKSKLQTEIEKITVDNTTTADAKRPKKLFISHSSQDIQYVSLFVNLLEDIGLSEEEIVCSSIPEYGIPLGADIYDWLSQQFQNCDLHVIFILSDNYYNSVACLNEMGAAWVLRKKYDTILLPEFGFPQIQGAINPQQIGIKLDSECAELKKRLGELKDSVIDEFEIKALSASRWERHRDEFIDKVNTVIIESSKEEPDTKEPAEKNAISKDAGVLLVYASDSPAGQITMVRSLVGLSVGAGKWNFVDSNGGAREEARWSGAIDELEQYGLIEAGSYKRQIFAVTNTGYKVADEIKEELNIDTNNAPEAYLSAK